MMRFRRRFAFIAAAVVIVSAAPAWPRAFEDPEKTARAWEETLVLPTYGVEPAEKNPLFYDGRAYQGAQGPVYPYAFLDRLTGIRTDKTYRAVYLENRYLKLCVLPELGGRLFYAVDKTNGYDFIYRQHVIKPALIGMLGAWISGGVEWNVPHHHRATTFMPVDHLVVNAPDGSATVWVGETELRDRTRWSVGLTLRPESSAIEVTLLTVNRTPLPQSMLFFANAAVHATPNYQVIFPPDTTLAAFHGKNQFSRWPVSTEIYSGQDYRSGVDVSLLKSHSRPTSFFAFNGTGDFLAGYDHGRAAGVCFVADHNAVPGKKLWTWGTGPDGALWERLLTDADGPYAELMFGAWSDNQPDYSWTKPYETRMVKQYWYPLRGIGGVKAATKDAACDLVISNGKAHIAFYATREYSGARAVLSAGADVIHEETLSLGPDRPFVKEMPWPGRASAETGATLTLRAADGQVLVRAEDTKPSPSALPAPVVPPPAPAKIATVEELYLAGLRLEQFRNPALDPHPYYAEALRRDPGDYRTNIAVGIFNLKRGLYAEAEIALARAVERATKNHTRPKDGEAFFYLGIARRALGRSAAARDAFQRAAWDDAWRGAAFFELATMACREGNYAEALGFINQATAKNGENADFYAFRAALWRRMGAEDKAMATAMIALSLDPLAFWGENEMALVRSLSHREDGQQLLMWMAEMMHDNPADYLEQASDYLKCGLWDEAAAVLTRLIDGGKKGAADFPLVHYMLAYVLDQKGDKEGAAARLASAQACPQDYGFPFQLEFIDILRWAEAANPKDGRAPYYLGNLLFDRQPEAALVEWEKAAALDPKFSIVHRNLGLAAAKVKNDLARAVREYESALACAPDDPKLYEEIDRIYEAAGVPAAQRLALLEKNHATVARRDDALGREIKLLVQTGRYDRAIELLKNHHFHVWEGGGEIYSVFVDAHLARGEKFLAAKKYAEALMDFEAARTYPANLEVAEPAGGGGSAKVFYFQGLAREGAKDTAAARRDFEKAASFHHAPSEPAYFEALALRKLGRDKDAAEVLARLRSFAEERLKTAPAMDYFAKFGERQSAAARNAQSHFILGLALLGSGDGARALAEFKAALAADPNHSGAARQIARIGKS